MYNNCRSSKSSFASLATINGATASPSEAKIMHSAYTHTHTNTYVSKPCEAFSIHNNTIHIIIRHILTLGRVAGIKVSHIIMQTFIFLLELKY